MTRSTLFLAGTFHVSSAILPATACAIIIMRIVCKDVHIFMDTAASRHAARTDEVIEQIVQLQFELVVVIRIIVTTVFNFVEGCVPALQLSLKKRADEHVALVAVNTSTLVALDLLTGYRLLMVVHLIG